MQRDLSYSAGINVIDTVALAINFALHSKLQDSVLLLHVTSFSGAGHLGRTAGKPVIVLVYLCLGRYITCLILGCSVRKSSVPMYRRYQE